MTILLTGATGLVGARLLPRLSAAGRPCRALVRRDTPLPDGVETARGDLLDPPSLAAALIDVTDIVHLASVFRTRDEALIWTSNVDATRNLIAAARAHAPEARFIFASTGRVYETSEPRARPGREDDDLNPEQAYPASKLAAERLVRDSGLKWAIIRFPFVYGDGDGHLEALPVHAPMFKWHPAKRMSTIHHRDIATAMILALDGAMDARVVNIADDMPASMLELLALGGGVMEGSAEPLNDPWAGQCDTTLALSLGFRPTIRTVHEAARENII